MQQLAAQLAPLVADRGALELLHRLDDLLLV
jgi:hypothetical protein